MKKYWIPILISALSYFIAIILYNILWHIPFLPSFEGGVTPMVISINSIAIIIAIKIHKSEK